MESEAKEKIKALVEKYEKIRDSGDRWFQIFRPSYLLKNEAVFYEKILSSDPEPA
ncbi:hypothetical protein KKG29_02045 [Patescibacteria group bacterium]|nr:hypothetical protein [Patescibacteria group bacterium]MBU3999940.1 hypothetical protein [Patescibacteria group bacterium]MBU4056653.1 hypothetical protein [Patescibacteria group bacterium]MBU4368371.1 hypothetical protein [Patescibacteria group bacterium]